jgi:threonine synthase
MRDWTLECSGCGASQSGDTLASLCAGCSQPFFVRASAPVERETLTTRADMWRYASALPLQTGERPVTLGEGMTPLLESPRLAERTGVARLWIKDEAVNPTGSFKARGLAAAVTRARALRVRGLVVPTAGNAGAALAAYAAAAGVPACICAPRTTPAAILATVEAFGAELLLVDGHIGDAGKLAMQTATERGYFNVATVREPYRVEGMKTMGYEVAEELGWTLPDAIIYPTGGGEGVIGIWKAVQEMLAWGWLPEESARPRMIIAQATGCAPLVRAFSDGAERAMPWENPVTRAAGIRVPGPLGDRLVLRSLRESGGDAIAIDEPVIFDAMRELAASTGIDASPEGGCAIAALQALVAQGRVPRDARVVVFNTGSGASYR